MKIVINEAIVPIINDGLISVRRIKELIRIKEFVDSVVSKDYLEVIAVEKIKDKYGVMPNIITWGDYFQSEMASSLINLSDREFTRAIETIMYDIISAYLIFSEKGSDFFEWVEYNYYKIVAERDSDYSEDEIEIIHLKLLMDYYRDMGIVDNFSDSMMAWYNSFNQAESHAI